MSATTLHRHVLIWVCLALVAVAGVCFFHLAMDLHAICTAKSGEPTFAFQIMVARHLALLDISVLVLLSALAVSCSVVFWRALRSSKKGRGEQASRTRGA